MAERKRIPAKSVKKKSGMTREMWAVVFIALGIIAALCFYTEASASPLGRAVRAFGLGILGVGGYVLPVFLLVFGVHYLVKRDFAPYRRQYVLVLTLLVLVASIIHLFCGSHSWDMGAFYTDHTAGGIIGGLLATTLVKLAGKAVAAVILIVVFLLLAVWLTGFSLADIVEKIQTRAANARAARKTEEAKAEAVPALEKPVRRKKEEASGVKEKEKEEPFNFDDIKIFTHDQMTVNDMPEVEGIPIEAPQAESKPEKGPMRIKRMKKWDLRLRFPRLKRRLPNSGRNEFIFILPQTF